MTRSVSVRQAAEEELAAALDWYEARARGTGTRLLAQVRAALDVMADGFDGSPHPEVGGVRRLLLTRFPYAVVFVAEGDHVEVLAFEHLRRRPGYWKQRP
jgi:plasmid stabilization system protein ParE